jgi:hypothetical protein
VEKERRGLRFAFSASAEIAPASSPTAFAPARVTELSFRGCFLETSGSYVLQHPVVVKIYDSGDFFEAEAAVLYVKPSGAGLEFRDIKPHYRAVLQKWILAALDKQASAQSSSG